MVSRQRFSADVHQELLVRIIRGEFSPGQRLKDTELAEQLGVSRTPVREALLRLEREGFISAQKHFGFSVKGLCDAEIREVYPLVSLLECTALSSVPLPCPVKLEEMERLCPPFDGQGADPLQRIELDSAWHQLLIEDNGNAHLLRILAELKGIVFRYEYAFMQNDELVVESVVEHRRIAQALEQEDRTEAVHLLGRHWERCTQATLDLYRAKCPDPADQAEEAVPALAGEDARS